MMKLRSAIVFFISLFVAVGAFSQDNPAKEGSKEIELNSEGQERENAPEINSREGEGSGSGTSEARPQSNSSKAVLPAEGRSSSSAGSPGVIIDAHQPDGTNTVPSAKPNIAGSKVPGSRVTPPRPKRMDQAKAGASNIDGRKK